MDNAWEEYKPEARKMLDAKRGDESHLSSARFVRRGLERVALEAWQRFFLPAHVLNLNLYLLFDEIVIGPVIWTLNIANLNFKNANGNVVGSLQ